MTAPPNLTNMRRVRRALARLLALGLSFMVRLWAVSCRVRVVNDPRPALRAAQTPYVYALLHEHQLAAVLANDEPHLAAMVSRSADGDLLVPSLKARGVLAVRGSGRRGRACKGGEAALKQLIGLNRRSVPVLLAVDGPRGPRGTVHRGIFTLARATGAVILPLAVTAHRALRLRRTWDCTQVPYPGTQLCLYFGEPLQAPPGSNEDAVQRDLGRALQQCATAAQQYLDAF